MRGTDETGGALFGDPDLGERIAPRHPLCKIRQVVNDAPAGLDGGFERLHADFGRPSVAPERLIRILFPVRVTPEACLWHDAAVDGADPA